MQYGNGSCGTAAPVYQESHVPYLAMMIWKPKPWPAPITACASGFRLTYTSTLDAQVAVSLLLPDAGAPGPQGPDQEPRGGAQGGGNHQLSGASTGRHPRSEAAAALGSARTVTPPGGEGRARPREEQGGLRPSLAPPWEQ